MIGNLPNLGIGLSQLRSMCYEREEVATNQKNWLARLAGVMLVIVFKGIGLHNQKNSWEQLQSELNVRFAEVNDPHHAFTILCKARQIQISPYRFMQRGFMLW